MLFPPVTQRSTRSRITGVLVAVALAVAVAAVPARPASASVSNPSCGWTTAWHGPLPTSSSYSDLRWFASQLNDRCRQYYPQVVQRLASASLPEWHPRNSITFVFTWDLGAAAVTSSATGIVYLDVAWFNAHPHDWGAIMHELTHVAGNYPGGQPAFVVEGIADAVRFYLGGSYPTSSPESPDRARCPSNEDYTSGYGCAAALLAYVVDVYLSVPKTQSMALTCGLASVAEVREDPRHGVQTPLLGLLSAHRLARACWPAGRRPRTPRSSCYSTRSRSCADRSPGRDAPGRTGPSFRD